MRLTVNGEEVEVDDRHATTPLLWVLREVLGMPGTTFGCGAGYCAACTVLIDGPSPRDPRRPVGQPIRQSPHQTIGFMKGSTTRV